MNLDFSPLTDDQLIDLIRAACMEAAHRGMTTRMAAENAMLDEAEKARIAHEAAARAQAELAREEARRIAREAEEKVRTAAEAAQRKTEQEKVAKTWEYKDEVGAQVATILKPKRDCQLKVWLKGADKRVYIGGGFKDNDVEYFHAGNHHEKPGTMRIDTRDLHIGKEDLPEVKAQLLPVLTAVCTKYNTITIPIPAWTDAPQEVA